MNVQEYANLVLATRDLLFTTIRAALPVETEMEKRFIQSGVQSESDWVGSLVNKTSGQIRIFVLLMKSLSSADIARTAGAKNFKPSFSLSFELFHDHLQGTDGANSQTAFESDAVKLQFAIETSRSLPPKAFIENYDINLGVLPSKVRSMHYGRGEIIINFREIRYE